MKPWHISILTLFPEIFPGPLVHSIAGKALEKNLYHLNIVNIRDFALDKNKTVDDRVFGGGAGMLMKPDVVAKAIEHTTSQNNISKIIYFSPRGKSFNQKIAKELVSIESLLILCGRYEGVDQRVFNKYEIEEYSMGDYILSGGEIPALTMLDVCIRLIPGAIDNKEANKEESFNIDGNENLLEYDQYTRPASWEGMNVPEILLSGNHKEIKEWRLKNALENTHKRRPDLIK